MTATSSPTTPPPKNVFRLHGVNVLNRKNVDSISRLTALEKRRTTHILDERQRRDTMNQLLGELANLVRESAAEAQQQQQQQQHQQKQYNPDGTEKKPPVKSNSITTLRNAISEIRRLRACAGLETITPPCAASLVVSSPSVSRSSSPMEVSVSSNSKQQFQQQQHLLPPLAPMAPQYSTSDSRHSAAMATPESYPVQVPHHQLQSPPLSPSSPKHQHYSSVSPPMVPMHHHSSQVPSLPSLFVSNSPAANQYYQQPQPHHHHHHHHQNSLEYQQIYGHSLNKTQYRYESPQSFSRPPSPGLSAPMALPQPYIQHSSYQSSPYALV
ncbi:hypothetical protein BGZ79_004109 [Entomortierella chlamydospora]|nr:hypothetical protein BGZ79_004109 [Entomortierella chlamydospora]